MPAAVVARLKEPMTEAKRHLNVEVFDAKLFQFDIVYSGEERKAFGTAQNASMIVIVRDGTAFEDLIPEQRDGVTSFLRLNNQAAINKVNARLPDARKHLRGPDNA